jgi:3,4-dihydroxy 2-butanone 4-phosphate synthase/GTP cyclohydrolase II
MNAPVEHVVEHVVDTTLPTDHGTFRCVGFRGAGGNEHVALVRGDVDPGGPVPLVRLHSECLTGDVLGSHRCDCGAQLQASLRAVAAAGHGAVVYLRGHEGRGIGLLEKLRAYRLQDMGLDTVDANIELGHPVDARNYGDAAGILALLGMTRVRLLTNNPRKRDALVGCGIEVVEMVPLLVPATGYSERYLAAKRERLGHHLPAS